MNDKANDWINPLHVENDGAARLAENLTRGARLRAKAASGWALGTFLIELPTPGVLASLALAGFDFVVLDMEHSSTGFVRLESLIGAGHAAGLVTLVRTWGEDPGLIGKVLDMGAHGVMAAHVDSPERAREVVDQARFAPLGRRGFSPITPFDALRRPLSELNDATYVICQIEGVSALSRAGEIARVPGVDAVFVGPYDLALSMGLPPGSKAVFDAAERIAGEVPHDRALGIYVDDPALCATWVERRFALQCVGFDGRMFADGARRIADQARLGMQATIAGGR
jgi:2-keto-3-deoxy-L-rhamnonate aldolase RhmA